MKKIIFLTIFIFLIKLLYPVPNFKSYQIVTHDNGKKFIDIVFANPITVYNESGTTVTTGGFVFEWDKSDPVKMALLWSQLQKAFFSTANYYFNIKKVSNSQVSINTRVSNQATFGNPVYRYVIKWYEFSNQAP